MLEQYYTEHLEQRQGDDDAQVPLVGGDSIVGELEQQVQPDDTGKPRRSSTPATPISTFGTRVRGPSSRSFDGASESPSSLGALEKIGLAEAAVYEKQVEGQNRVMQSFVDGVTASQKQMAEVMAASQKQMADAQSEREATDRGRLQVERERLALERQKFEEGRKERESQQAASKTQAEFMMEMLKMVQDMRK
jgi:PAB1-binding protein PBP1